MLSIKGQAIELTRGDTAAISINFVINDDFSFAPGDMLYFSMRKNHAGGELVLQKVVDDFDDPVIVFEPSDTKEMPYGLYLYDLQLSLSTGDIYTILGPLHPKGPTTFSLLPEVTYE